MLRLYIIVGLLNAFSINAQIGINTVAPNPAAALDINGASSIRYGGVKLPLLLPSQKAMIPVNPASDGMLIYVVDGTYKCLEIYDQFSNGWQKVFCNPPVTLFTEDFQSYTSTTGVSGTGNSGNYPALVSKWNLNTTFANLTGSTDYGQVRNGVFEIQDVNGVLIFNTQVIDISSVSYASFSIDISEEGTLEYDHTQHISDTDCGTVGTFSDFLDVQYSVDNGVTFIEVPDWQGLGSANHTFIDDFTSANVQVNGIVGSSLIIRVLMQNWADGEFHRIDNIIVTGL